MQAKAEQIAIDDIEADEGAAVAQVHIAVDGRATNVHASVAFDEWLEFLFLAGKAVVNR